MRLFDVSIAATIGCVKTLNAKFFLQSEEIELSRLTDNSRSSRFLKIDITCEEKQMPTANVFWRLFTRIRDIP